MTTHDDNRAGGVWPTGVGLVVLAVALVIGLRLYPVAEEPNAPSAAVERAATRISVAQVSPPGVAGTDQAAPSVRVDGEVVRFHFADGKAELAEDARDALGVIVKGVAAGRKAVVSEHSDATGDVAHEPALARQRVEAVRNALLSLGIGEDKLELRAPALATAGSSIARHASIDVTLE